MKKRDSQQELVEEYLNYKVVDPLRYNEFEYDKSEWDNIPTIISKFITFMSKHIEALTNKWNERFGQISTEDLQLYTDSKLYELEQKFNNLTSETFHIKAMLSERISKIENKTDVLFDEREKSLSKQIEQCETNMKDLIPIPTHEDYIREYEKEAQAAEEAKVFF